MPRLYEYTGPARLPQCPRKPAPGALLKQGIAAILALALLGPSPMALAQKCLYVSSYHQGYEWNDGIEKGIESVLAGKCELDKFYMDTKRNTSIAFAESMALSAKRHIEASNPDVVIAGDDNASRFLVKPYYRDAALPIVFCGINWTVDEYGYPYQNATGMVEVIPIRPLLNALQAVVNPLIRGVYLSSDVYTEYKDFERYRKVFSEQGVGLDGVFVKTLADWEQSYSDAQTADFIVLGNNAGINDWEKRSAARHAFKNARTFTVTNYDWMMPYAMFAMTKLPEEQGEWAAKVALSILAGEQPADIPIIVNRRWNILVNSKLLEKTDVSLPAHLSHKAVRVGD